MVREFAGDLLRRFIPAGYVMDHHDPGLGAGPHGTCDVRVDRVALVPARIFTIVAHTASDAILLAGCAGFGSAFDAASTVLTAPGIMSAEGECILGRPEYRKYDSPCKSNNGDDKPIEKRPPANQKRNDPIQASRKSGLGECACILQRRCRQQKTS